MSDVRGVVSRILESGGALVEPMEPDGLEVLAPAPLQEALDLPELCRLGFGEVLPADATRISLESEWMDKLGEFMACRGGLLCVGLDVLDSRHQPPRLEALVRKRMVLENATFRFQGAEHSWTQYLVLFLHLAAVSDEKREEILPVCLNESSRLTADHLIGPLLMHLRRERVDCGIPADADLPARWPADKVQDWIARFLPARIRARMEPFLAGMARRMSRDLERLFAYHTDLRREAAERLAGKQASDAASGQREISRIEAIEREYRAKITDLRRKYAMTVEVELVQALRLALPVVRVPVKIMRKKGVRLCHLDWNPLSKQLDDLYCEACGTQSKTHVVCNERLHLLCPDCMAECSSCGKSYCRACHPGKCPKCDERDPE